MKLYLFTLITRIVYKQSSNNRSLWECSSCSCLAVSTLTIMKWLRGDKKSVAAERYHNFRLISAAGLDPILNRSTIPHLFNYRRFNIKDIESASSAWSFELESLDSQARTEEECPPHTAPWVLMDPQTPDSRFSWLACLRSIIIAQQIFVFSIFTPAGTFIFAKG